MKMRSTYAARRLHSFDRRHGLSGAIEARMKNGARGIEVTAATGVRTHCRGVQIRQALTRPAKVSQDQRVLGGNFASVKGGKSAVEPLRVPERSPHSGRRE